MARASEGIYARMCNGSLRAILIRRVRHGGSYASSYIYVELYYFISGITLTFGGAGMSVSPVVIILTVSGLLSAEI